MLLRSTSAPILDSWLTLYSSKESSAEADSRLHKRTKSVCMCSSNSMDDNTPRLIHNVHKDTTPKPRNTYNINSIAEDKTLNVETSAFSVGRLFSNSRLGEKQLDEEETDIDGVGGGGGGKISKGRGDHDCGGGGDAYYRRMIETNPGNSLLLGNYAKFLKEVKGETKKAQEYCERAILANPDDGDILSLYAHLIWQIQRDPHRAQTYFAQAVKSSPTDCYVQASYASFLWEVEEQEADEDNHKEIGHFPSRHPPVTAAS